MKVAGYGLRVARGENSWGSEINVTGFELRVAGCGEKTYWVGN